MKKIQSIAVVCGDITAALNRRPELMQLFRSSCEKPYFFCAPHEEQYYRAIEEIGFDVKVMEVNTQGMNPIHDAKYFWQIYNELKTVKPDHVFIFHVKQILYAGLACRLLGLKYHCLFAGLGILFAEKETTKGKILKKVASFALRRALRKASTVFFQNPDDRNTFVSLNVLSKNANVVVVDGSGVSLSNFQHDVPVDDGKVTFLLVARLLRQKGLPEYYEAAKKLNAEFGDRIHCQLLGPFDNNPDIMPRETIEKWNEEGVIEYLGVTDDVRPLLRKMDVFVLPSYYMEGTPKIILESLAIGRPIITCDSRGCRETVDNGTNGFLIQPRNVDQLYNAMKHFIVNPDSIQSMGQASRQLAQERYDVNKINRKMLDEMKITASS